MFFFIHIWQASRITYKHIKLEGASNEVKAMDSVQEELAKITFTNNFNPFGYTRFYVGWETNKVKFMFTRDGWFRIVPKQAILLVSFWTNVISNQ